MSSVERHYTRHAERLSQTYLDVSFEDVHGQWIDYLPPPGARVLDVGAGSGRDARALAERGYLVTAVEPSAPMRMRGARAVEPFAVRWIDDQLPALELIRSARAAYAFVLCSAVLMHVPEEELGQALDSLAAVTAPKGRIALSLRESRPADPIGVYHDHADDVLIRAASSAGLSLLDQGENLDRLHRLDAVWRWFVFALS